MSTSELMDAAGNQLGEVAGCHRVRRRHTCWLLNLVIFTFWVNEFKLWIVSIIFSQVSSY